MLCKYRNVFHQTVNGDRYLIYLLVRHIKECSLASFFLVGITNSVMVCQAAKLPRYRGNLAARQTLLILWIPTKSNRARKKCLTSRTNNYMRCLSPLIVWANVIRFCTEFACKSLNYPVLSIYKAILLSPLKHSFKAQPAVLRSDEWRKNNTGVS